jgi:predicted nucleic acid-binding protein
MMKIVVDSSVVIKWFVVEVHSPEARRLLTEYQNGSLTLLAPDLLNAEIGTIVWKKQTLQNMAAKDAEQVIETFRKLSFTFVSNENLLNDAYQLAVKHQRTVYDMLYVALSIREGCDFVTSDERLVNAVNTALPNVIWLPKWTP